MSAGESSTENREEALLLPGARKELPRNKKNYVQYSFKNRARPKQYITELEAPREQHDKKRSQTAARCRTKHKDLKEILKSLVSIPEHTALRILGVSLTGSSFRTQKNLQISTVAHEETSTSNIKK
jgi:hypothetical protein